MKNKDLRDKYTEKTSKGTETQGFFYEEYVLWLEEQILALHTRCCRAKRTITYR